MPFNWTGRGLRDPLFAAHTEPVEGDEISKSNLL